MPLPPQVVELERVKQLAKMDHERRVKELREKEGIVQNKLDMKLYAYAWELFASQGEELFSKPAEKEVTA